ncbi:hypothetical protein E2C01_042251 [Portunus trituberculatus]|uniref:Uncharacterized protein n=1 Tax=Portunus trituberculatus TaxID=210409 RepID=A0A5B7FU99_PORTR|nr:hypothetical protein [Portunus trituberculatus]
MLSTKSSLSSLLSVRLRHASRAFDVTPPPRPEEALTSQAAAWVQASSSGSATVLPLPDHDGWPLSLYHNRETCARPGGGEDGEGNEQAGLCVAQSL